MKLITLILTMMILASCQTAQIAEKNKTKSKYHVDIAKNLLAHNKNPEAIAELNTAIKLMPKNAEAHHLLAISLYQRGKFDEALNSFRQSLKFDPTNTKSRNDFITLLLERKLFVEAFKEANISANDLTYPQPEESLFLKSLAAIELSKRYPKLESTVKKSLEATLVYNPNHCGALYHLGDFYNKHKDLKKSYVLYHKSLKSCQNSPDKLKALNALIPLSKKFGLVYQWGRYKELQSKISKKPIRNKF